VVSREIATAAVQPRDDGKPASGLWTLDTTLSTLGRTGTTPPAA